MLSENLQYGDRTGENKSPAISVVVPVYNRLELLRETVQFLRQQTLADAEFLLVDDRSEKETWEFLCSLPREDRRFRVLLKPAHIERGCQSSRNIGLENATARYIMFLDSDDLLAPNCLSTRLEFIETQSNADIVVGNQAVFQEASGQAYWVNVQNGDTDHIDRFLTLGLPIDVPWVNAGCLIRTNSLRAGGVRWRESFHWDDVVFHLDCLLAGLKVQWIPRSVVPDAWYRLHGGEHYGAKLMSLEGLENTSSMFRFLLTRLHSEGLLSSPRHQLLKRSFFHCCILRAVDQKRWMHACSMIREAVKIGLLSRSDARVVKRFVWARNLVAWDRRLRFQVNQWFRRWSLQEYFSTLDSSYCSIPVPELAVPQIAPFRS
jgi:glycosyltransferase involved in cell wall biosynthesis